MRVGNARGDAVTVGAQLAPVVGDLGPPLLGHQIVDGWSIAVDDFIPGSAIDSWDDHAVRAMAELSFRLRERLDPSPGPGATPPEETSTSCWPCWRVDAGAMGICPTSRASRTFARCGAGKETPSSGG